MAARFFIRSAALVRGVRFSTSLRSTTSINGSRFGFSSHSLGSCTHRAFSSSVTTDTPTSSQDLEEPSPPPAPMPPPEPLNNASSKLKENAAAVESLHLSELKQVPVSELPAGHELFHLHREAVDTHFSMLSENARQLMGNVLPTAVDGRMIKDVVREIAFALQFGSVALVPAHLRNLLELAAYAVDDVSEREAFELIAAVCTIQDSVQVRPLIPAINALCKRLLATLTPSAAVPIALLDHKVCIFACETM